MVDDSDEIMKSIEELDRALDKIVAEIAIIRAGLTEAFALAARTQGKTEAKPSSFLGWSADERRREPIKRAVRRKLQRGSPETGPTTPEAGRRLFRRVRWPGRLGSARRGYENRL